ncbi:hypothetical protein PMAYCL1PPCAC_03387, partial [Pristionchus mayeri]
SSSSSTPPNQDAPVRSRGSGAARHLPSLPAAGRLGLPLRSAPSCASCSSCSHALLCCRRRSRSQVTQGRKEPHHSRLNSSPLTSTQGVSPRRKKPESPNQSIKVDYYQPQPILIIQTGDAINRVSEISLRSAV